jgi:hypothetical protein
LIGDYLRPTFGGNQKRIWRLYSWLGLQVRKRQRKKAGSARVPLVAATFALPTLQACLCLMQHMRSFKHFQSFASALAILKLNANKMKQCWTSLIANLDLKHLQNCAAELNVSRFDLSAVT